MKTLLALFLLLPVQAYALIEIGDAVPEMCWTDLAEKQVCLSQHTEKVRVLVYNTGWCPDCQREFTQLAPRAKEFSEDAVVFISLSSQGWTRGAPADTKFLNEWQARYNIPFPVAASPADAGRKFFNAPYFIPRAVVIDKEQKLAFKQTEELESLTVDELFAEVRKALQQ